MTSPDQPSAVRIDEATWQGRPAVRLENASLALTVTRGMGPRIIDLRLHGGENLLAELPAFTVPCPGAGDFHFWGGHRLWEAPEVAARTYLPDDSPVDITDQPRGLVATAPSPPRHGLGKRLRVTLPDDSATVNVDHELTNASLWPIRCAPWAITMFPPGGVALLPQPQGPADPDGLLPNRRLSVWPYSDVGSTHLAWGNRFLRIEATLTAGAFKIGWPNSTGWLAYWRASTLFVKWHAHEPAARYPDGGCSAECYCNEQFLELETLGPLQTIEPGETIAHRERWGVFPDVPAPKSEAAAGELAARLNLARFPFPTAGG